MTTSNRLLDYYLPPQDGFILESLLATTYQVDFAFLEEELLPAALGVRTPLSRMPAFRSEVERRLQETNVTILYDLAGCERLARLSPRIDPISVAPRKLHAKIALQLWTRPEPDAIRRPDRRIRLVVGSANLSRQGFRENYECVASLDFGGRESPPRSLLESTLQMLRDISAGSTSKQLAQQLTDFEKETQRVPVGTLLTDGPVRFVRAEEVEPALREVWSDISSSPPSKMIIVSPFWLEGAKTGETLAGLVQRLGPPAELELVCRGVSGTASSGWLPEFDAKTAQTLRAQLGFPVFLRAASANHGTDSDEKADAGDETEDAGLGTKLRQTGAAISDKCRSLHAKAIVLTGAEGSALYIGSSNCTRRGLHLGGPSNWEAGLVYRLGPKGRQLVTSLLAFAGPPIEVLPGKTPLTITPELEPKRLVPLFLSEVIVMGTIVVIRFREGQAVPDDLRILMEDLSGGSERRFWILYRRKHADVPAEVRVDLDQCLQCDGSETEQARTSMTQIVPHVQVEVQWSEVSVSFPVRFDDKLSLPSVLLGRKPTEGELIEYFLYGREPGDGKDNGGPDEGWKKTSSDEPIDTRRILAYFMRRFVQAIPGIEAEITRAAYSRPSLEAALRGPTSPLALAEHAASSMQRSSLSDEPDKTVTAVGFQLVEIIAILLRVRQRIVDPELVAGFEPVVKRCRDLLDSLPDEQQALQDEAFQRYRSLFAEDAT